MKYFVELHQFLKVQPGLIQTRHGPKIKTGSSGKSTFE
jgi:hypothetical protein